MICLQNLCKNFIAEEFERFNFAFTASNNEKLKRNFEFVQIKYSSELASELFKRRKLKEQYLGFIINKHLKFLEEKWIFETPFYRNSMEDIFRRLPNLTKISCKVITDEILENIAKFCPKIVEIGGKRSSVKDRGLKYLCKNENGSVPCSELKKLYIKSSNVTVEGLGSLIQNLKSLEILDHPLVPLALHSIHKDDLPKLENVPSYNLVTLGISYGSNEPYYKDLLKICVTVCPKLEGLTCVITEYEQLDYLNHTCLKHLNISFNTLRQKMNIDSFLKLCGRNLLFLTVDYCILSISEIAVSCPKLQHLSTTDVSFTGDLDDSKTVFHSLVKCRFRNLEMNSKNIKAMAFLLVFSPNLQNVAFINLSLNAKISILKCDGNLPLEKIFVMDTSFELNLVKDFLLRCPSLRHLSLIHCYYPERVKEELLQFLKMLSSKPRIDIFP